MSDKNTAGTTEGQSLQFPIKVTPQPPDEDGNVQVHIEYGEGFRDWFMEREGLKRWSEKRFEKVMKPLIEEFYSNQNQDSTTHVGQRPDTSPFEPVTE